MDVLHELRCTLWSQGAEVRMDVELRTALEPGKLATEVLARGAPVWRPDRDDEGFDGRAAAWFLGEDASDWKGDPAELPDDSAAGPWGDHVAHLLELALGSDLLDDLLVKPAGAGRLRFPAPHDPRRPPPVRKPR